MPYEAYYSARDTIFDFIVKGCHLARLRKMRFYRSHLWIHMSAESYGPRELLQLM